jgi:demethylmenaquinone methyltransferase/2-methoxy-6-polyprenyl-1,4-benzoquinol methylase
MNRRRYFDEVSNSPDPLLFTPADHPKLERLRMRLGDLRGKFVLEPGCGAGPLTELLSRWVGAEGRILAFDSSRGMIAQCRSRLGRAKNVEIVNAAMEELALDAAAWDLVILFRVFPHFEDKPLVLRKLRTSIATGGRLVIANLVGSGQLNALHAGFSEPVRHDRMPCLNGMRTMLEETGFEIMEAVDEEEDYYLAARPISGV